MVSKQRLNIWVWSRILTKLMLPIQAAQKRNSTYQLPKYTDSSVTLIMQ